MLNRTEIIDLLNERGITPTQQRVEIAQFMFTKSQHLSAEQVMDMVNQDRPTVSKATVYNTLGLFAQKGLVKEVIVDPSKVFYDTNTTKHHHFYDVDSGQLMDIDADEIHISQLPDPPEGKVADGIDVIIRVRGGGGTE